MHNRKESKKMDKKDHAGMKSAAKVVKNIGVGVAFVLALVPGLKGISNFTKKS